MRPAVDPVLARRRGVATRAQLLTALSRNEFDDEVRRGRLVAVFPRAYARPWDVDQADVRDTAALLSVGSGAVLGHLSALRRWRLPVPAAMTDVHVIAPVRRHPRGGYGLVVHRPLRSVAAMRVDGLPVLGRADAAVLSWPLLRGPARRAPLLAAVRQRWVSVDGLRAVVAQQPRLSGRAELIDLLTVLAAGCESELELWGYRAVFDVPGLRHAVRQRTVRIGGRSFRLDMAYEDEQVAVELDGREYHAGIEQWEADIRRDLLLATAGWQTIRLSHRRLTADVAGCRRDVLEVLAARSARRRAV